MLNELVNFNQIRVEARAYLTYLLVRNLPNFVPEPDEKTLIEGLKKIDREVDIVDALYLLDAKGTQIGDNISRKVEYRRGAGSNRSNRAYFYRCAREKKPIMTDPYPSQLTNRLCVSAAMPIYDNHHRLRYVAVLDVDLENILKAITPVKFAHAFGVFSKGVYALFSLFLLAISLLLIYQSLAFLTKGGLHPGSIDLKEIFESTILLTLALAMFDLVKAIFEEEVLGRVRSESGRQLHRTMTRFLGSIIIAVAIEALMLVFKSTLIDPEKLIYAVYLLGGLTLLLFGLAFYIKWTNEASSKERE
ncbi:MAG: PDC sensor domain-containing protein [Campylobacterales bacterium]